MDKVLSAYQAVAFAVARYIDSHSSEYETYPIEFIQDALGEVAAVYGMDLIKYEELLRENNDISGSAESLRGDDLALMRITGTLSNALGELASCMYDPEAGVQIADVMGRFLGTVLIIKEFENA